MYSDWITKTNHNLQKVIKTLPAIMTKAAHKTNTDLMSRIFHLFFHDHILLGSRRRALPRQNFLPENLNEQKGNFVRYVSIYKEINISLHFYISYSTCW